MTDCGNYALSSTRRRGVCVYLQRNPPMRWRFAGSYRRCQAPGDDWFATFRADGRACSWCSCEFEAVCLVLFFEGAWELRAGPAWWPSPPRPAPIPFQHMPASVTTFRNNSLIGVGPLNLPRTSST